MYSARASLALSLRRVTTEILGGSVMSNGRMLSEYVDRNQLV